ncbi:FAD-dependent oxidoreductase [soil metagenome]
MTSVAIIGSGIAGLGCAHLVHRDVDITVFEREPRAGGHSHTLDVPRPGAGAGVPVDTGFMVFNRVTYPLLCRLFDALDVPAVATDMSFSVRDAASGLEWCGSSLNHLFAQRRNLLRPRFWKMLRQIDRFNKEGVEALNDPAFATMTLADYVAVRGYGADFLALYLVPMSAAVWSTPPAMLLDFPAATLLRFFHNHGFLGLHTQHQWWTIAGGSREYVQRLTAPWRDRIRLGDPVRRIERSANGVRIITAQGERRRFDRVIVATHADEALALLADPTAEERAVLGAFKYQHNRATVHGDTTVMPRTKRAWASWNYEIPDGGRAEAPATHYWMNRLQPLGDTPPVFVSINGEDRIDPRSVHRTVEYAHPLFNHAAVEAQAALPSLNLTGDSETGTYFCGSYARYGFHEDALWSAAAVSAILLGRNPWITNDDVSLARDSVAGSATSYGALV